MQEREIKFRFFCPPAKGFVESYNYKGAVDELFNNEDPTLVPSQYTGEKDDFGKEIWEGDIVEFKKINFDKTFKSVIKYERAAFLAQVVEPVGTLSFVYLHTLPLYASETRVIGNKYENPELLHA
jgi:uncharacterized phage protein (TIGR01671 family)